MRTLVATTILATTTLLGLEAGSAIACPVTIPMPASAADCQCFTVDRPATQRCAAPLPQATCQNMINTAFNEGLLTDDGWSWLWNNGFCPMVMDVGMGPQIYDFCPMGCFAADTEILSSVTPDGQNYSLASEVTRDTPLVSMADEATLSTLSLTGRSVDRVVHGPEVPPLFVFTLADGTTLRVTEHHPMVLDDGMIVEADQVDVGASFVTASGQSIEVKQITREQATEDVFNFQTTGETQLSHIIVANNVLVGDLKLQNELAAEEGSIELRR